MLGMEYQPCHDSAQTDREHTSVRCKEGTNLKYVQPPVHGTCYDQFSHVLLPNYFTYPNGPVVSTNTMLDIHR